MNSSYKMVTCTALETIFLYNRDQLVDYVIELYPDKIQSETVTEKSDWIRTFNADAELKLTPAMIVRALLGL